MKLLDNLKYTENHEWILIEENIAVVGVTDYAQKELGDIVFVDVDTVGTNLKKDDVFGSVEAVKTVSDLFMPINAQVLELNPDLENNPELINQSPYEKGWIVKLKIETIDTSNLLASLNKGNIKWNFKLSIS